MPYELVQQYWLAWVVMLSPRALTTTSEIRELAPSRNGQRRVRETDGTRLHRRRHTEPTEGPFNADLRQFVLNLPLDTPSAHLRNALFIGCRGVSGLLATTAVADMPVGMPTPSDSARSSASVEHRSGARICSNSTARRYEPQEFVIRASKGEVAISAVLT